MTIPRKMGIDKRKVSKNTKMKLTDTSIPPIPLSCVYYKIKYVHEEKLKEKWPADSYFSTLIVNDDLSIGDKSCGNYSMKITLSLKRVVVPIMAMWVLGMFLKTSTLSTNVKIKVPLRRWMWMLKIIMVMWLVYMVFK